MPSEATSAEPSVPSPSDEVAGSQPGTPLNGDGPFYLSDLCALTDQENAWGPVERRLSNGAEEPNDGGPITVAGSVYEHGLGAHAPSNIAFSLGGACTRLQAALGVDDEVKSAGSVVFEVLGDGESLYRSDVLTGDDEAVDVEVDISGVDELRLVVSEEQDNGSDHADWADARIECQGAQLTSCEAERPEVTEYPGYELVWSDEFEQSGRPNPEHWSYESGFVRNEEAQWYQEDNATVQAGFLIIEGRRERVSNPNYQAGSSDWKRNRQYAEYTASSLHSRGKASWQYGRLEMRGRFPAHNGLWPAWWTLGLEGEWPWNGEVDILEFYQGALHANFVVGTNTQWEGNWDTVSTNLSSFGVEDWDEGFHVYRMDWDDEQISLYVDGQKLNDMSLDGLRNPDGSSPFMQPHYMLLNLAIGGQAGGDPSAVPFPVHYEVDWVRVYQGL